MSDDINEIPSSTSDFRTELAKQLAELVPEAIADGKIDVEKLQELLGEDYGDDSERFGLFWPGKRRALRAAQEPTTATLKPVPSESKDWGTTQNVYIEGDNLEVLKILQKHYHNKIKMIYVDPPYNTGNDFIYPDNYAEGLQSYLEFTRQVDEEGRKLKTNTETEGRYHSNWLNMMYPRLKLARNLLTDDGAVFISIDDAEFDNLRKLANEVFGEVNFVGTMVWAAGRKNDSKYISTSHEYIVCYARNLLGLREQGRVWKVRKKGLDQIYKVAAEFVKLSQGDFNEASSKLKAWYSSLPTADASKSHKHYCKIDERGVFFPGDISWPGGGGPQYEVLHPTTKKPVKIPSGGWRFPNPETMRTHINAGNVLFGLDENQVPTFKRYLKDTESEAPYSVFYQDGRAATKRLRTLMWQPVFDYPKDEIVLSTLVNMVTTESDVILDFFSGSATTAHAVMQLNAEDGGNRRFIQVQLPEPTPAGSEARNAGYKTIAEIGRKRIDLAGEKIKAELDKQLMTREIPLDIGYRTYKLVDTNFPKWRGESDIDGSALRQELLGLVKAGNGDSSTDDLLIELLLKQGYSLTEQITDLEVDGLTVLSLGDNLLLAYLDTHVKPTLEQFRALAEIGPAKLVVLDDVFKGDDELKTNLVQICKSKDIELWTA